MTKKYFYSYQDPDLDELTYDIDNQIMIHNSHDFHTYDEGPPLFFGPETPLLQGPEEIPPENGPRKYRRNSSFNS